MKEDIFSETLYTPPLFNDSIRFFTSSPFLPQASNNSLSRFEDTNMSIDGDSVKTNSLLLS